MGGSDQWGNITSGTEFIRRNTEDKAYAVTTPLLTKSDGSKFGKSEQGNIWLDSKLTSPYKFYQFWVNASDADLPKYFRYFSLKTQKEIEALEKEYGDNPNHLKRALAEELTIRVHSQEDFENVANVSNLLFNKKASHEELLTMTVEAFTAVADEIPSHALGLSEGMSLEDVALQCEIFASKSEYKRAIKANAISVNKVKISDDGYSLKSADMIHCKYMILENVKKNKYCLIKE